MAYCTIADVQQAAGGAKRLRELSDFEGRNALDAAIVERAIAKADAVINTYVHRRYGVDLEAPVPHAVTAISAEEAVFSMKADRGMVTEVDMSLHQERLRRLEEFGNGKSTLGVTPMPTKSELVVDRASGPQSDRAIQREKFEGFT